MKTMTCKQLGGPCDHQLQGDNADAVIAARRQPISASADARGSITAASCGVPR